MSSECCGLAPRTILKAFSSVVCLFLPCHSGVKGHPKVSCFIKGQVVASDLQVGFHFFVGETEHYVGGFLYVKVDQPSLCPLLDLPECFLHSDSSCSNVLL